jgi:hypothetical protein
MKRLLTNKSGWILLRAIRTKEQQQMESWSRKKEGKGIEISKEASLSQIQLNTRVWDLI